MRDVTQFRSKALMTNEMHNSVIINFIPQFLSAVHVSNEFSRSSSRAQNNVLFYTVRYNRTGESSCYEVLGETELWNKIGYNRIVHLVGH